MSGQTAENMLGSRSMTGAGTQSKNPWAGKPVAGGCNTYPTYFLSGPMRGQPRFGFDAFDEAAETLRKGGAVVLSPADHDRSNGFNPDRSDALDGFDLLAATKWDLQAVLRSDAVVLLPGWEKSEGALIEVFVANAAGIELLVYPHLTPIVVSQPKLNGPGVTPPTEDADMNESVTQEAHRLVHGPRQDSYGHPFFDLTRSGRMMGAIIGELKPGEDVPPEKVALCMVAVKISREVNRPSRDNRVDGAGYFDCVDLVQTYKEELSVGNST